MPTKLIIVCKNKDSEKGEQDTEALPILHFDKDTDPNNTYIKPELAWRWGFSPAHNGAKAPSPGERGRYSCHSVPTLTYSGDGYPGKTAFADLEHMGTA